MSNFKAYTLDAARLSVSWAGGSVTLTAKEFALAELFFANAGRPLRRETLMRHVWGHRAQLATRTLDVHIGRLRRKLRLSEQGVRLRALHAYGYILEAETP